MNKKSFDIVICVHNSPKFLKWCLDSILQNLDSNLFNLIIIDDFSDEKTKKLINNFSSKFIDCKIITNQKNLGYVKSVNEGIKNSVSENVVLLNSDVLVTKNLLSKFQNALKSDSKIGLISVLSNNAANLTIKLPPGFNYNQINELIEKKSKKIYPDAMTIVGHCMLISRSVIDKIGLFDEIYSPAYAEETDYHFLAINNGFRAVILDDAFVYHKGEGSIKNRNELLEKHLEIFRSRWGKQYDNLISKYQNIDELKYLRNKNDQLPFIFKDDEPVNDVVFLLPGLSSGIGGILTVVEIVNGLVRSGINANIAYLGRKTIDLDLLFEPIQYENYEQVEQFPPKTKILVATEYGTVNTVSKICEKNKINSAYFIQDYEGWFDPLLLLEPVKISYQKIKNKIVVSHWLKNILKLEDDQNSVVIPVGVYTNEFYPLCVIPKNLQDLKSSSKLIVLSLLSNNERRGSIYFIQAMREIIRKYDDIGFVITQRTTDKIETIKNLVNLGMLERKDMPKYFSACDVIVDCSLFHGFGLPGLEGMACGLAPILTDVNLSYSKNDENCLSISPKSVVEIKNSIIKLYEDKLLLQKLKNNAIKTAEKYNWDEIVPQFIEYFDNIILENTPDMNNFGRNYYELRKFKNTKKIIQQNLFQSLPANYNANIATPREILNIFKFYCKQHGFIAACKESLKWLYK